MFTITKEEHEALPESLKSKYKAEGEGFAFNDYGSLPSTYVTAESVNELKRAHDRNKTTLTELKESNKTLTDKIADLDHNDPRKKGDIEHLEKGWNAKYEEQNKTFEEKLSKKNKFIEKSLVDVVANEIANDISLNPKLILPHLKSRLRADFDGDEPKTQVLDQLGNPSVMTVAELSKEFADNKDYSDIMKGSEASGSGAGGTKGGGGSAKSLKEMTATEEAKFANENPELHKKMVDQLT